MDKKIKENLDYFKKIRKHLHSIPELGFNENKTSQFICEELDKYGIEYEKKIAKTGVIAWIKEGESQKAIALRADLDALEIQEKSEFAHKSCHKGQMHACGHDGHIAMLLAAAKILNETRNFEGIIYFIFQPAEEGLGGAKVMIDEGILERYKFDKIFAIHNWPTKEFGKIYIKEGPIMASIDTYQIKIKGKSSHSAMPHIGINPIVIASHIVIAIKSISALDLDPSKQSVITVAKIEGGEAINIIPDECSISGSVRTYDQEVQKEIEKRVKKLSNSIADAFDTVVDIEYHRGYPQTINNDIISAKIAAKAVVGEENIETSFESSFGAEDFSYFLQQKKGCYIWFGSNEKDEAIPLHNSKYDFNDNILEIGIGYWIKLVEEELK